MTPPGARRREKSVAAGRPLLPSGRGNIVPLPKAAAVEVEAPASGHHRRTAMLRSVWMLLVALAAVAAFSAGLQADDKKGDEKTVTGTVQCAKCHLKEADDCATVIKAGEKVYYFDKESDKKYHSQICRTKKDGTVVGTVTEKDGKMVISVKKLDFK
jgi:hypothetical protein